jgi:hypothetical protein
MTTLSSSLERMSLAMIITTRKMQACAKERERVRKRESVCGWVRERERDKGKRARDEVVIMS